MPREREREKKRNINFTDFHRKTSKNLLSLFLSDTFLPTPSNTLAQHEHTLENGLKHNIHLHHPKFWLLAHSHVRTTANVSHNYLRWTSRAHWKTYKYHFCEPFTRVAFFVVAVVVFLILFKLLLLFLFGCLKCTHRERSDEKHNLCIVYIYILFSAQAKNVDPICIEDNIYRWMIVGDDGNEELSIQNVLLLKSPIVMVSRSRGILRSPSRKQPPFLLFLRIFSFVRSFGRLVDGLLVVDWLIFVERYWNRIKELIHRCVSVFTNLNAYTYGLEMKKSTYTQNYVYRGKSTYVVVT